MNPALAEPFPPALSQALAAAAACICAGGVIAYPTEAVFGLGCDPGNARAVRRVLAMKQRPAQKGLILIASEIAQLEPYLAPISAESEMRLRDQWPGPVTWLVPARASVSPLLRGAHATLAVRVTAHPVAAALCRQAGTALVSTSANLAGQPPAHSIEEVRAIFGSQLDSILDAPLGDADRPTVIRDLLTGEVVRA
jgi:L-threonylcarbamoyladenylate synthase